jgi:hypothetical protein
MEKPQNKKPITGLQVVLMGILLLGLLYFLQKSGCSLTRTEEKREWLDLR